MTFKMFLKEGNSALQSVVILVEMTFQISDVAAYSYAGRGVIVGNCHNFGVNGGFVSLRRDLHVQLARCELCYFATITNSTEQSPF